MIVIAEWDRLFKSSSFTFAKDQKEYEQRLGEDGNLIYEVCDVFEIPEVDAKNIFSILAEIPYNQDSVRIKSFLAAAFYFGLNCGRNEKKNLKTRLSELTIVAGRARWQGTEILLGEIEKIKKRLAELG